MKKLWVSFLIQFLRATCIKSSVIIHCFRFKVMFGFLSKSLAMPAPKRCQNIRILAGLFRQRLG